MITFRRVLYYTCIHDPKYPDHPAVVIHYQDNSTKVIRYGERRYQSTRRKAARRSTRGIRHS